MTPVTLTGAIATLEPLSESHRTDLELAVTDGELWRLWYTMVPAPQRMLDEIRRRLALRETGSMMPFAVVERASGKAVGMTTYMNVEPSLRRLEIGSTWYAKRVQRTALNTECKLMLLQHAFESLACVAVEFRTSAFNYQSRRAIERIGAKLDGVLRRQRLFENAVYVDTYVYSILADEWPAVKRDLQFRLSGTA